LCSENWSRLGLGGPGFHGKPGPAPELWPGRPVPTETFELVPVVAGTLVPVEEVRLVLVSRGSRDLSLSCGRGGQSQLRPSHWSRLWLGHWSRLRP